MGSRYSHLEEIDRSNVQRLVPAWRYDTGESDPGLATREEPTLEATPIVVDGVLYFSTPLGRVIALDADTGEERWVYDARIDRSQSYGDFTSRGVSVWIDRSRVPGTAGEPGSGVRLSPAGSVCSRRIFVATIDARLIALDAAEGGPCSDFGDGGQIDLRRGLRVPPFEYPAYQVTSPPLVIGDLVVTGSAIADNSRRAPASGEVRAFDVRTGQLRWSWDPIPQTPADPAFETWEEGSPTLTGVSCSRRLPARHRITTGVSEKEPVATGTPSWRSTPEAARWCGVFRRCTTTCGITTTRRRPPW